MKKKEKLIAFSIIAASSLIGMWFGGLTPALIAALIAILVSLLVFQKHVTPTQTRNIFFGGIACLIPFALIGAFVGGSWMPWPQFFPKLTWRSMTLDSKIYTAEMKRKEEKTAEKKEDGEWKELLSSLKGIAHSMDKNADGQDALRKELVEGQKSLTEEIRRSTKVAEEARDTAKTAAQEARDAAKAAAEKAELDSAALQGKRDAIRDFEKGDTRKARPQDPPVEKIPTSPSLTLPEFPPEELPQITIPRRTLPEKPPEPAEPEDLPVPARPKGNLLPKAAPRSFPKVEQRASAPREQAALKCTCNEVHEFDGYDVLPSGISVPRYTQCAGGCKPVSYGKIVK